VVGGGVKRADSASRAYRVRITDWRSIKKISVGVTKFTPR